MSLPSRTNLFKNAKAWLEDNSPPVVIESGLAEYFEAKSNRDRLKDLSTLYRQFLKSLANANMKTNVITGSLPQGIDSLAGVTSDFSPEEVRRRYDGNYKNLWHDIKENVRPKGKKRSKGLWPKYCRTILETADFLSKFESSDDFNDWVNSFSDRARFRAIPALLISNEIYGAGLALACNVLIDLGFDYAKPDVHVRRILSRLEFINEKDKDYHVLRVIFDLAAENSTSAFALDKALYLIGSGNYFKHDGRVQNWRRRTDEFIEHMKHKAD